MCLLDLSGTFLFQIADAPPVASPRGIFARHGRIYLADSGHGTVHVFDRSGSLVVTLGEKGSGPGQMIEPVDVVADSKGRIYAVNSGNNRIEIFEADGTPAGSFPIDGWTGTHLKESYLAIDDKDVIYMTDWEVGRVRRFDIRGNELPAVGPRVSRPSGLVSDGSRIVVAARGDNRLRVAMIDE